jgi:hypothetical protein
MQGAEPVEMKPESPRDLSWTSTREAFGAVGSLRTTQEIGPPPPINAVEKPGGNWPISAESKLIG